MRNPIFFWLLLIFTIANIVDSITAMYILPGEANPIFLITGSMWPIMLGKLFIIIVGWFFYFRNIFPSNVIYYACIAIVIFGSLVIGLGAYSNIYGITHPQAITEAAKIPAPEKQKAYFSFTLIFYLIPLLLNMLVFTLYEWSRKYTKIDPAYYKKKKWWQI